MFLKLSLPFPCEWQNKKIMNKWKKFPIVWNAYNFKKDFSRINQLQLKLHKIKLLVHDKSKQCLFVNKYPTHIKKGFWHLFVSVSIRTFLMVMGNQTLEQQKVDFFSFFKFMNRVCRNKESINVHYLFLFKIHYGHLSFVKYWCLFWGHTQI